VKAFWGVLAAAVVDQLSKTAIMAMMTRGESISVIGDYFRLTYIRNPGAAFSMNLGGPVVHTLISFIALAALVWLFRSTPAHDRLARVALILVLGGALGNIVDRIRFREVVDFLDFGLGSLRWPVFNFADSCVTVGVILLALTYLRSGRKARSSTEEPGGSSDPSTSRA